MRRQNESGLAGRALIGLGALVATLAGAGCVDNSWSLTEPLLPDSAARGLIVRENLRPGDTSWNQVPVPTTAEEVAAYLDHQSVLPGDTVRLYGIAADSEISVRLYRVGWYVGAGARLVLDLGSVRVPTLLPCSAAHPGPAECPWPASLAIPIPPDVTPGFYMVRYTDRPGAGRFVPLVVRASEQSSIVVVMPFNTYQAYNGWGGASFYQQADGTPRAPLISFMRPYTDWSLNRHLVGLDLPLARFLERWGYPVSYVTDLDFHAHNEIGFGARLVLVSGHSEYWSGTMRTHAERLRDDGVGLAFFGANDAYWQVRYEGRREGHLGDVLVCYKSASDPLIGWRSLATRRFRDLPVNRPENAVIGIMYNLRSNYRGSVRLMLTDAASQFLQGTGFQAGDSTTAIGGWEGDKITWNGQTPHGIRVVFRSVYSTDDGAIDTMQTTFYQAPSGAGVFAAGTIGWNWALDDLRPDRADARTQRFVRNLLDWYLR